MMIKAWFIVAVMSGVYTDGDQSHLVIENFLDHGHFHNAAMCQKFIGDHPFKIAKALISQYGSRPPEQIMCVPEDTVRLFMEEGGRRGEPT